MASTPVLKKSLPLWRPKGIKNTSPSLEVEPFDPMLDAVYRPDVLKSIEDTIDALNGELRMLSMDIHEHPELKFEERYAHDALTAFMRKHGFEVTEHYMLETAWVATFAHGDGGRTLGINSEMDALPGIGHACGHNLIAISGVAVALAVKMAMEEHGIAGKIVLLGTPAEEAGSGKAILLEKGAYEGMDACLMCHPGPGAQNGASMASCLAVQRVVYEYHGHTAHAALAPWEGQNAQDAAVLAYTSVGLLRQQIKPSHRIHGIIEGREWAPNIIPDYAKLTMYTRAPTRAELTQLTRRVQGCLDAAAVATACTTDVKIPSAPTFDLRQNEVLGDMFSKVFRKHYGPIDSKTKFVDASTDFGNVTYALPAIHPFYAIPTVPNGGNHTTAFTAAAATAEAHDACLSVSKALALTGLRVLADEVFAEQVKAAFADDQKRLSAAA